MEPVKKPGKGKRGTCKKRAASGQTQTVDVTVNIQGLSRLHMACLYGQMTALQLLVESMSEQLNSGDPQGRRPIHMVLSSRSSPNTTACLRHLLESGADVTVTTDSGQTPLHLAASEGLLDCTEILVKAGADVTARDNMGHTPLDLARIWCHRKVARFLRSCMWMENKKKEMKKYKEAKDLYSDLVTKAKLHNLNKPTLMNEKKAECANKKGFRGLMDFSPKIMVSKYHSQCLLPDQDSSAIKHTEGLNEQPEGTMCLGLHLQRSSSEPDLRDSVTVWRDGSSRQPVYTTKWDIMPHSAPDLPLNDLKRMLFPRAFPSRIVLPQHFEARNIVEVQHKGFPQGRSTSPCTEVAMHLAEVLTPGHH